MEYNYEEAITADVKNYIEDNINLADYPERDELEEKLNDDLWVEDSVTGNASGSYTSSRDTAAEYLAYNFDLLGEAFEEFDGAVETLKQGAEACDVTIRCYMLGGCISSVLDDLYA